MTEKILDKIKAIMDEVTRNRPRNVVIVTPSFEALRESAEKAGYPIAEANELTCGFIHGIPVFIEPAVDRPKVIDAEVWRLILQIQSKRAADLSPPDPNIEAMWDDGPGEPVA
jgi:Signal recognition particle GTPase